MKQRSFGKSKRVALAGVLSACSLVLLYLTCYSPTGKLGLTAAAGLFPAAAVCSCGFGAGFLCYAGTALLALLLISDKNVALLYLLFFGLYPMVKGQIEKLNRLVPELILKLLFFNAFAVLIFRVFSGLLIGMLPENGLPGIALAVIANIVFLLYDYGFSKVITFYRLRVERNLNQK